MSRYSHWKLMGITSNGQKNAFGTSQHLAVCIRDPHFSQKIIIMCAKTVQVLYLCRLDWGIIKSSAVGSALFIPIYVHTIHFLGIQMSTSRSQSQRQGVSCLLLIMFSTQCLHLCWINAVQMNFSHVRCKESSDAVMGRSSPPNYLTSKPNKRGPQRFLHCLIIAMIL